MSSDSEAARIDYDSILKANATQVFSQRDAVTRRQALERLGYQTVFFTRRATSSPGLTPYRTRLALFSTRYRREWPSRRSGSPSVTTVWGG
ncbi:hypothetical protein [Bradyrhizobium sp. sGM-13]|uniref:hypothetical protein n=1 Tax=Bradyrhizobium sp. sGM-13 TaxID=2831781 RepID=UPI0020BDCD11|nr:hypothetical protein [Bradyrhizobium sp. sGM-13]